MLNNVSLDAFTKFSKDFLKSKLNKCKSAISKGSDDMVTKSLASRLIQLKNFQPPSLSEMNSHEWSNYLGKQLTRNQAKDLNLLGTILPYETEGQFELNIEFGNGSIVKRGNIILSEEMSFKPSVSFNYVPQEGDNLTFILFDSDFPMNNKTEPFILWQINDVGSKQENEVFPYMSAIPERGSGVHRIVGIVMKNVDINPVERQSFNINEILSKGGEIISYNYFQTLWTKGVTDEIKNLNLKERLFDSFLYGSASSLISCSLLQPFDVIKTQVQELQHVADSSKVNSVYFKTIKRIYCTDGVYAFWKGLSPTIIRNVPGTGLYFLSLDFLAKTFPSESMFANLAFGSISRVFAGQILMPFTVLKVQMESQYFKDKNLQKTASRIYRSEGLKGFFKGSFATLLRDAPSAGLFYMIYRWTKKLLQESKINQSHDICNALASLNASLVSTIVTNPFDVLKTRTQLIDNQSNAGRSRGTWTVPNLSKLKLTYSSIFSLEYKIL